MSWMHASSDLNDAVLVHAAAAAAVAAAFGRSAEANNNDDAAATTGAHASSSSAASSEAVFLNHTQHEQQQHEQLQQMDARASLDQQQQQQQRHEQEEEEQLERQHEEQALPLTARPLLPGALSALQQQQQQQLMQGQTQQQQQETAADDLQALHQRDQLALNSATHAESDAAASACAFDAASSSVAAGGAVLAMVTDQQLQHPPPVLLSTPDPAHQPPPPPDPAAAAVASSTEAVVAAAFMPFLPTELTQTPEAEALHQASLAAAAAVPAAAVAAAASNTPKSNASTGADIATENASLLAPQSIPPPNASIVNAAAAATAVPDVGLMTPTPPSAIDSTNATIASLPSSARSSAPSLPQGFPAFMPNMPGFFSPLPYYHSPQPFPATPGLYMRPMMPPFGFPPGMIPSQMAGNATPTKVGGDGSVAVVAAAAAADSSSLPDLSLSLEKPAAAANGNNNTGTGAAAATTGPSALASNVAATRGMNSADLLSASSSLDGLASGGLGFFPPMLHPAFLMQAPPSRGGDMDSQSHQQQQSQQLQQQQLQQQQQQFQHQLQLQQQLQIQLIQQHLLQQQLVAATAAATSSSGDGIKSPPSADDMKAALAAGKHPLAVSADAMRDAWSAANNDRDSGSPSPFMMPFGMSPFGGMYPYGMFGPGMMPLFPMSAGPRPSNNTNNNNSNSNRPVAPTAAMDRPSRPSDVLTPTPTLDADSVHPFPPLGDEDEGESDAKQQSSRAPARPRTSSVVSRKAAVTNSARLLLQNAAMPRGGGAAASQAPAPGANGRVTAVSRRRPTKERETVNPYARPRLTVPPPAAPVHMDPFASSLRSEEGDEVSAGGSSRRSPRANVARTRVPASTPALLSALTNVNPRRASSLPTSMFNGNTRNQDFAINRQGSSVEAPFLADEEAPEDGPENENEDDEEEGDDSAAFAKAGRSQSLRRVGPKVPDRLPLDLEVSVQSLNDAYADSGLAREDLIQVCEILPLSGSARPRTAQSQPTFHRNDGDKVICLASVVRDDTTPAFDPNNIRLRRFLAEHKWSMNTSLAHGLTKLAAMRMRGMDNLHNAAFKFSGSTSSYFRLVVDQKGTIYCRYKFHSIPLRLQACMYHRCFPEVGTAPQVHPILIVYTSHQPKHIHE